MEAKDKIIVALDVSSPHEAIFLVEELRGKVGMFKIGLQLFTAAGRDIVKRIRSGKHGGENIKIFLDLKLYDNPDTVAKTMKELTRLKPEFITISTDCGDKGMLAAIENSGDSKLLAVSVLTGFTIDQCQKTYGGGPSDKTFQFTLNAFNLGMDGAIIAPTANELGFINSDKRFDGLIKVSPGIRPHWAPKNDQGRTAPPYEAIKRGADYLVIGRPIAKPPREVGHPARAIELITEEIDLALAD